MTAKPESSLSNRFWTPAFAGVTNFGIFYEFVKIKVYNSRKCYTLFLAEKPQEEQKNA
jgi:hypothetical protein